MRTDFIADTGIFVHVHALHDSGTLESQLPAQLSDSIIKCELSKDRMLDRKRMTDFVQGNFFRHQEFIVLANCTRLEEEANFVARFDEIFVSVLRKCYFFFGLNKKLIKLISRESAHLILENTSVFFWRLRWKCTSSLQHFINFRGTEEVVKDKIPIPIKLNESLKKKLTSIRFIIIKCYIRSRISLYLIDSRIIFSHKSTKM
jgi:hypothetical protein